jgi:hypothetical protein
MALEFSHGLMGGSILVTTKKIRNKAMVYSSGQIKENIKEAGLMASSKALGLILRMMALRGKVSGSRARELSGYDTKMRFNQMNTAF